MILRFYFTGVFLMFRLLLLVFVLVPLRLNAESEKPDFTDFQQWLVRTAKEAETRGISRQIINLAFTGLEPDPRVISFDVIGRALREA